MSRSAFTLAALLTLAAASACSKKADIDELPVGTDVQVTRDDGGLVQGKLQSRSPDAVRVSVGPTTRTVPRDAIADVRVVAPDKPAPEPPPAARFREFTIPAGTELEIRLQSAVDSRTSHVEDAVHGHLVSPVSIEGVEVLPANSAVHGDVRSVVSAGKVKGRATVAVAFRAVEAFGDRQDIDASFSRTAASSKDDDAKKIGIPAAAGGVIGAIIDGKKGAAIGAAIGGGAGTAAVLTTRGDAVVLPVGTVVTVRLKQPVEVRVPLTPRK